jgi:hypothetical protein
MTAMIKLCHQQPSLWHRGLLKDIEWLWEPWMRLVDQLLEGEQLLDTVYEAQGETPSPEPHPRPDANVGGSIVAAATLASRQSRLVGAQRDR